jgi:hypothetical protein
MDTDKHDSCIFCGKNTAERRDTSMGLVSIHTECVALLEQLVSTADAPLQGVEHRDDPEPPT